MEDKKSLEAGVKDFISSNKKFRDYLFKQGISSEEYQSLLVNYATEGRRCFRFRKSITLAQLKSDLHTQNSEVGDSSDEEPKLNTLVNVMPEIHPLFSDLCLIDRELKINHMKCFKDGDIVGIEASSAIIVKCLGIDQTSKVLDMCCSPGAKLLYISDILKSKSPETYHENIVGCDISYHRSQICKSFLAKHGHPLVIVYRGDSTRIEEILSSQKNISFTPNKVLVDVECTHEGSLKHILKFILNSDYNPKHGGTDDREDGQDTKPNKKIVMEQGQSSEAPKMEKSVVQPVKLSNKEKKRRAAQQQQAAEHRRDADQYFSAPQNNMDWGIEAFADRVLDEKKLLGLAQLQTDLLLAAMRVCALGGEIIYSTCSLMRAQNEDILLRALAAAPEPQLVEFRLEDSFAHLEPAAREQLLADPRYGVKPGSLQGTYYIQPNRYSTGGMFVSRLLKLAKQQPDLSAPNQQ